MEQTNIDGKSFKNEQNAASEGVRLNKYLSDAGVCSRREADKLIETGKVEVNGAIALMGQRVTSEDSIKVNGKLVKEEEKWILIACNKPRGIVCTTSKQDPDNIVDFLDFGKRIYPIGRLDKDSEGLILLTNKGDIADKILRGSNYHEKEYIVKVNKKINAKFIKDMSSGVAILDTITRPCEVTPVDETTFRIILTQGLNRQIRRMCEALGYKVMALQRVRVMNIKLGRLHVGGYRNVTDWEKEELNRLLELSSEEGKAALSKFSSDSKQKIVAKQKVNSYQSKAKRAAKQKVGSQQAKDKSSHSGIKKNYTENSRNNSESRRNSQYGRQTNTNKKVGGTSKRGR